MGKKIFKFEELSVYKKSIDFIDNVYIISKTFPKDENYRLTSQFIRASSSISLNIAEGSGDTNPQFSRFLRISIGSIKECIVCITIAKNQNYISEKENIELREKLVELSKMISGLIKYLKKKKTNH
ncbi:MAG: four helix bundle protein [Cryomorphaceae bacterium BACL22 MAG-120619-bin32]|jgi:four helix bundle protein|nr:MAG: four helix bundle protein [Cryomorphaceae bacterium BACL22 MAG-120619-bin32]